MVRLEEKYFYGMCNDGMCNDGINEKEAMKSSKTG